MVLKTREWIICDEGFIQKKHELLKDRFRKIKSQKKKKKGIASFIMRYVMIQ